MIIQGIKYFDASTPTNSNVEQLIVCRDQIFWYLTSNVWIQMGGFMADDNTLRTSMAQGVNTLMVVDGVNIRVWDGSQWLTDTGTGPNDPPKGATILLWHAGRMWAAGFTGTESNKENDAIWGSALGQFGAGDWDNINRQFRIGRGEGDPIVAMASLQANVMCVLKQNSVHLVHTDPTVTFTQFQDDIPQESISNGLGCIGKRAWATYGNDLFFVSPDKNIYSVQRMQAAANQWQLSAPVSLPMQPFMDRINWNFAYNIAAKKYRELVLFSVPLDAATQPNTVLVYNGRLQRWVGIWTGWTPQDWEVTRFGGVQRLVFGDKDGNVKQWKDFRDQGDDATYTDDGQGIHCQFSSRAMLFNEPLNEKDPFHSEFRFSASNAIVKMGLVADNADLKSWSGNITRTGPTLPVDLPFDLVNPTNTPLRKGLRGLRAFNEVYTTLESDSGWWSLRNASMSAYLNSIKNQ